jgi:Zn-finger nucleic acid-binding protein
MRILGCGACSGIWLDNAACQLLIAGEISDAARELLHRAAQREPVAEEKAGYREAARPSADAAMGCPVCRAAMTPYETKPEAHGARVKLDVCPAHGTWFDHGEAWALFQAVSLKTLALDVELQADAAEARWAAGERVWSSFVAGAMRRY